MSERNYSDEAISAFVDGQLTQAERIEMLAAATESDHLRRRICETEQLKELVCNAYPEERETGTPRSAGFPRGFMRYGAVAALGALSLYLLLGATGQLAGQRDWIGAQTAAAPLAQQDAGVTQVVFHISSDDRAKASELLDEVELVLKTYAEKGAAIRIEVVANNQGIRMFQQGRSTVARRLALLYQTYPNLVFAACGNTIERLQKSSGERIRILPEVVIVRSGISFVARRQQSGWSYIKV